MAGKFGKTSKFLVCPNLAIGTLNGTFHKMLKWSGKYDIASLFEAVSKFGDSEFWEHFITFDIVRCPCPKQAPE